MNYFVSVVLVIPALVPWALSQGNNPTILTVDETRANYVESAELFTCKVLNRGNSTVIWRFVDHDVTISNNLKVLIQSTRYSVEQPEISGSGGVDIAEFFSLEIRDLTHSDQGLYVCSVEGGNGTATYQLDIIDAVSPTPPVNVSLANHTECCLRENVSSACLPLCDRATLDPLSFKTELCANDVLKLIKCGTDGRNHISCCRRRQVPVRCLEICSSSSPTITEDQYLCELYDPEFNACYNEGQLTLPTPPQEVAAVGMTNGFSVEWLEPKENDNLVTGYRIFYRSTFSTVFQSTEVLGKDSRSVVVRVSDGGEYVVYVIAISLHGTSQPSSQVQLYSGPSTDPNAAQNKAIKGCCGRENVNPVCESSLCKTGGYRSLTSLYVQFCENDLPHVFHCISGGQDHSNCCRGKGLPEDCIGLCTGEVITFNQTLVPCLVQLQTIESCLEEGFNVLPSSPPRVRVDRVDSTSTTIEWDQAYAGNNPVDSYIVRYKLRTNKGQTQSTEISTAGLFAILSPLHPDRVYEATVTSVYMDQSSLASPTLIFQTYAESDISSTQPSPGSDMAPVHPDMAACCAGKGVPADCHWLCSYSLDFHNILKNNYTALRNCSSHITEMLTCASDNRNHSSCCETSLVPEQCLYMCALGKNDPLKGLPPVCQQNSGNILKCYALGVVSIPQSPENVTLTNYTSRTITLKWDAPASGPPLTEYIIRYIKGSFLQAASLTTALWQQDRTNRTVHIMQNLRPGTIYVIAVISANENGTSVTRDYVVQPTIPEGVSFIPGTGTTEDPKYANPNPPPANRSECCAREGLEDICLSDCEAGSTLNTSCPQHIFSMLICASDGADHTPCCDENGVPYQCKGLCEGQGQTSRGDPIEVFCGAYVNQITFCLQRKSVAIPSQPRNVIIRGISSRSVRVLWDPPQQNADSVKYVFYYARFKTKFLTAPVPISDAQSPLVLSGLIPDSLYQMYLIAENHHGVSQTSSKHVIRTQAEYPLEAYIYQLPQGFIDLGGSVSLTCGYTGSPIPLLYEWWLNAQTVHIGRVVQIANASLKDEGWYTCQIKNQIDAAKQNQYLALRYKPVVIYVSGDSVVPDLGYTAMLTCMFKGRPSQIEWSKDGRPLKSERILSKRRRDILANGTTIAVLEVGFIKNQDFGNYSCRATNTFGYAEAKSQLRNALITVVVQPTPPPSEMDLISCCKRNGVQNSCMHYCDADLNHDKLMNEAIYERCKSTLYTLMACMADRRDSTLCCRNSRIQDICLPMCSPETVLSPEMDNRNCLSNSERVIQCLNVSLAHVPTPPENVQLQGTVKGSASIAWNPPVKNRDQITFYHIFYQRVGDNEAEMISLASTFTSDTLQLKRNGVFQIWMVAGNIVGQSVKSNMLTVTVKDIYANPARDLHGQSLSRSTISLTWSHPESLADHIDRYVIYFRSSTQILYNNVSTAGLETTYVLVNLTARTEYEVFLRGKNYYGLGEKSNTIYVDTIGDEGVGNKQGGSSFSPVGLGVGLAVVLILLILLIIISVYFYRMRRPTMKQPGAVSFENPSYYETNNPIQIRGLRNDVPDSAVHSSTANGGAKYGYDQPNHPAKEAFPDHDYATLQPTQTNGTNHVDASDKQNQSEI